MDRYEYMRIPSRLIPDTFLQAYDLTAKIYKGYLYGKPQRHVRTPTVRHHCQ
jgi:hypothetical protein